MKSVLSILHITDLHITNSLPPGAELKIEHAVDAAISKIDGEQLFVVVSGDVAAKGAAEEYDKAEQVFTCLLRSIEEKYKGGVALIMVPGNHDISDPPELVPEARSEADRAEQLAKMDDFFCFSLCRGLEWNDPSIMVIRQALPQRSGFSGIRFCCLNTAPFSTLKYDKGVHFLPRVAFTELKKDSPSELSVIVAHHGPEWLDDSPRLELESEALRSVDFMLIGHEHRGSTFVEDHSDRGRIPLFRGGTFSLSDENECVFTILNVSSLHSGSYQVDETRFEWDSSSRIFIARFSGNLTLEIKGSVPRPKKAYLDKLADDFNRGEDFFCKSFSFPRLRSSVSLLPEEDSLVAKPSFNIESPDDFFSYLEKWDCVEIAGSVGSGKSCLARALYIECVNRGFIPILIHPDNSTPAFKKTLHSLIFEQYGEFPSDLAAFEQAPKNRKILIADDFDRIKKKRKKEPERLIRQMLESFGKVIITVPSDDGAISHALFEGHTSECVAKGELSLCACTKQVRDPLVTKLCKAADLDERDIARVIRAVDQAVHGHSGLFELTPAFITQYVDYFLANSTEMLSQDELPFKHIFNSNIRRDIVRAARSLNREQYDAQLADAVVAALQDVALRMHIRRKSVMDVHEVNEIISSYAEAHDVELRPRDVLEVAEHARLLVKLGDGVSYQFSSLYVHAYFVARRIDTALDLNEADIAEQIDRLLKEICFSVNQEVIVFLTQLRLSAEFPEELINRARRIVGEDVPLCPLDPEAHKSLSPLLGLKVSAIDEDESARVSSIEDYVESDGNAQLGTFEYADYYDNDSRMLEIPVVRALMAVKYAELAAGYLVKQFAKMPRDTKRIIRGAIFQIPQSAANVVISDIDSRLDELATSVARSLVAGLEEANEADSFARKLISVVSLGSFYGFMGIVMAHASEGRATVDYLLQVEGDTFGHDLGRLYSLLSIGDSERFVKLCISMAERARSSNCRIELIIIKVLANQFLRECAQISQGDKHRLLQGVFGLPGDSSNAILRLRGR